MYEFSHREKASRFSDRRVAMHPLGFNRVQPGTLGGQPSSLLVDRVKRGSFVSTDQFKGYDGLVAYGFRHERIDKTTRFATGRVYLNGIEGFWSFAKERLAKFHGMSVSHFPLYLK